MKSVEVISSVSSQEKGENICHNILLEGFKQPTSPHEVDSPSTRLGSRELKHGNKPAGN